MSGRCPLTLSNIEPLPDKLPSTAFVILTGAIEAGRCALRFKGEFVE
jgi:hypothetical protein